MVSKTVLITGASGYLGRNLVPYLQSSGLNFEFYLPLRDLDKKQLFKNQKKLNFLSTSSFTELPKIDVVIHLATTYGRKGETREQILKTNVEFPLELINIIKHDSLSFINTDTSLPDGLNDYSTSKSIFTKKLRQENKDIRVVNIELEQFYGPNDGSFLGFVKKELDSNKEIELTDGLQKRDFIFLEDVLRAYLHILKKLEELPKGFINFPLGLGESHSIREVVEMMCDLMGKDQKLLLWGARDKRTGEPQDLFANLEPLKSIGFSPSISLKEGVKRLVNESK